MTWAVTDRFNVIAGGRIEQESQTRDFIYEPIHSVLKEDETFVLPKLVFQYDLSDATTVALGGRSGYSSPGGALNFAAQEYYYYDKETVDTYELSVRSFLSDGDLRLSANLFYNDYDGYQAQSSSRFIENLDDVVTYGAEFELVASLTDSLRVNMGLGLLGSDIKDTGGKYPEADGNELNSAPTITANVGVKYFVAPSLAVGLSVQYVDEYFGDFENTEERIAGGYTLTRFTTNYNAGNWLVSVFVNNLFDEEEATKVEPIGRRYPQGYAAIVAPRSVGVSATYRM